jgi:O-glycosyl hydrolase
MLSITIDASQTFQIIESFGASDCWTVNYVGQYWNEAEKEQLARLLFSRERGADGKVEGIGLSAWRFNLGAGTREQGDASGIAEISRRAENFLSEDNDGYDWSKQAGQQWFLRKAIECGVHSFVAFSVAPPIPFSRSGRGYGNIDGKANLREDAYGDFADYLTAVADHFRQEGINFEYISPLNEPQWNWYTNQNQEGCSWENDEIKKLVVELDKSIQTKAMDIKILLTEAARWDHLYQPGPGRGCNQIAEFFDPRSPHYIGGLPSVPRIICGHSYFTHTTNLELRTTRRQAAECAAKHGLTLFQTEWSMMDGGEGIPDPDKASYMDIALFMAKVIYGDLVFANVSSWSFWTSMDMEREGVKNRFLLAGLAPGKDGNPNNPITEPGTVYDRPTLWALGNYSLFIRPGYRRIELTGADDLSGLMGSAYISPDKKTIVAVYVNMAEEAQSISVEFTGLEKRQPVKREVYVTDSNNSLEKITSGQSGCPLEIPARSVFTAVYWFNLIRYS